MASGVEHYDPWPLVQRLWAEAMRVVAPASCCTECRTLHAQKDAWIEIHEPGCWLEAEDSGHSIREVAVGLLAAAAEHERKGKLARAHELRRRAALLDVARLAIGELLQPKTAAKQLFSRKRHDPLARCGHSAHTVSCRRGETPTDRPETPR